MFASNNELGTDEFPMYEIRTIGHLSFPKFFSKKWNFSYQKCKNCELPSQPFSSSQSQCENCINEFVRGICPMCLQLTDIPKRNLQIGKLGTCSNC